MNTRPSWLSIAVLLGAFTFSGAAVGDDALIGQCENCHGKSGVSVKGTVPTISGISSFVHADYLYAYRDGARVCNEPDSKEMCTMTSDLTDDQIEALGEHFAGIAFKAADQSFDADKATAGAVIHEANCSKCHTDGGSNPDDDASILAGQWMPYMNTSLSAFASGSREQPKSMQRKTEALSEADIEALAHYYASQQ